MNMSLISGKKVEIISEISYESLVKQINLFLSNHKNVWNIQYQHTGNQRDGFKYSALIIYDPNSGDGKEK